MAQLLPQALRHLASALISAADALEARILTPDDVEAQQVCNAHAHHAADMSSNAMYSLERTRVYIPGGEGLFHKVEQLFQHVVCVQDAVEQLCQPRTPAVAD